MEKVQEMLLESYKKTIKSFQFLRFNLMIKDFVQKVKHANKAFDLFNECIQQRVVKRYDETR